MQRPHPVSSATAMVKKPMRKSASAPGSSGVPPKTAPPHPEAKRATARLARPPSDPRIDDQRDHLAAVDHAHRQQRRWTMIVMGLSLLSAGLLYAMLDRQAPIVVQAPPPAPINHPDVTPTPPPTSTKTPNATAPTPPTQTLPASLPSTVQTAAASPGGDVSPHTAVPPTVTPSTTVVAAAAQPLPVYSSTGTPDPFAQAAAEKASTPPAESVQASAADVARSSTPAIESTATPVRDPSVTPENVGAITLSASSATITSKTARLQGKGSSNPHIGSWNDREGGLTWTTTVSQPGRYSVTITYACNKSGAGGVLKLSAGTNSITDTVVDTGSWDTFAPHTLQQPIEISQSGEVTITLEPQTKKSAAFMKFSSLVLTPVAAAP